LALHVKSTTLSLDLPAECGMYGMWGEIQALDPAQISVYPKHWGPFSSREEAIAKRIGLIRAGKCQPQ
jgi:hypothetical protein